MASGRGFLLLAICAIALFHCVSSRHHHDRREVAAVKRATFNVTLDGADSAETTADILTRLKLLAYAEKLKAKQVKKKAKADKKAEKDKAWAAYLSSLVPTPAPGTAGTATGAAAPPMIPSLGLMKKSFILQQIAMMQAQAAAAAAAAAQPTTPVAAAVGVDVTTVNPYLVDDSTEDDEDDTN